MNIGIVGLGLIGGSLAKAFKSGNPDAKIYGYDINDGVTGYAEMDGTIDKRLDGSRISECDYIFIALYPSDTVKYVISHAAEFKKSCVVIDCCGVKKAICGRCFAAARENGFSFIGGHPMAGVQYSGFKYSRANMFNGACMILVPRPDESIELLSRVKDVIVSAGFSSVTVTTSEKHDEIIAFTSQLAHVVSNAYVKSPSAEVHKGFSAGSYKDLTRVARLNEGMWTELFLDNAQNLSSEIGFLINELEKYKSAIDKGDNETLTALLREGRIRKERIEYSHEKNNG